MQHLRKAIVVLAVLAAVAAVCAPNTSSAKEADDIVKKIRAREHFGKTLANGVEFTNTYQRTMVMYMAGNPTIKRWIELEKAGEGKAIRYISDKDDELAMTALFVIGRAGNAKSPDVKKIEKVMLKDKRWVIRNRAVLCLYKLGQMDMVKEALNDPFWNVRLLAVRAIGRTGDFDGLIKAAEMETERQKTNPDELYVWEDGPRHWVLMGIANEMLMNKYYWRLDEMLRSDPDVNKRLQATLVLGWMEESPAMGSLDAALNDEDPRVRALAVKGIGQLRWENHEPREIVKMLRDKDVMVRETTVETLLDHWNPLMCEFIAPILDESDADAAYAAACAMYGYRHELLFNKCGYQRDASEEAKSERVQWAKDFWAKYGETIKKHDLSELDFLAPPDAMDLDMLYVQLTPEYSWGTEKVRPDVGEKVTWVGHLENKGRKPSGAYTWTVTVNGKVVHTEKLRNLAPHEQAELKWETPFHFSNDWITFSVKSDSGAQEITNYNNSLTFRENSIAAGYWVEDGRRLLYDVIQAYFHRGANSYEDWQQRNLAFWNASIRRSVFLLMPEGGLEDIRAQKIVRCKDGDLPLHGGISGNNPDMEDHTVDVMWGFPGKDAAKKDPFGLANWRLFTWLECSLHHEMSHARYLVDFYGLNMRGEDVEITLPSGKRMFPPTQDNLHYSDQGIIMKSGYFCGYCEAHSAAWGRIVSRRAINGAWNASPNIGEYLSDLPSSSTFRILDTEGKPIDGASVDIYQCVNDPREWNERGFYERQMDDVPDISGMTDAKGEMLVADKQLFSGGAISGYLGNTYFMLVVRLGDQLDWRFYDITDVNLEAWEQGFGPAKFTFQSNISRTGVPVPEIISGQRKGNEVELRWTPTAKKYDILLKNGNIQWDVIASNIEGSSLLVPARDRGEYCVVAIDEKGRRSARSAPFGMRPRWRPQRVAVDVYGDRHFLADGMAVVSPTGNYLGVYQRYARGAADLDIGPDGTMTFLAPATKRKVKDVEVDLKNRVGVLRPNIYLKWFSGDDEASKLVDPKGVAIAPDGKVYVASTGSKDIVIFNADGTPMKRVGSEGTGDGQFLKPVDIDVMPDGSFVVADEEQGTVQLFDAEGAFKSKLSNLDGPRSVAFDPTGNIYVLVKDGIAVFTPELAAVTMYTECDGEPMTDVVDFDVSSTNEVVFARKEKEELYTLPPINGVTVEMTDPVYFIAGASPVAFHADMASDAGKCEFDVEKAGGECKCQATDDPERPGTKVSAILEDDGAYVNENTLTLAVKNDKGMTLKYDFPVLVKEPVKVTMQISRAKRTAVSKSDKFVIKAVLDNCGTVPASGSVKVADFPKGTRLVSGEKTSSFKIEGNGRKVFDYVVEMDSSKGIFAAPFDVDINAGGRDISEEYVLEAPMEWKLFGPIAAKPDVGFATSYPPEEKVDFSQTYDSDGLKAKWFDLPVTWPDYEGVVNLHEYVEPSPNAGMYAYTVLYSDVDRDALLCFGTDDTITAWLNGEKIIEKNSRRGVTVDEDIVPVTLKAGANPVLLKVWNGEGGWGFIMRVTDRDGNVIPTIRALPNSDAE